MGAMHRRRCRSTPRSPPPHSSLLKRYSGNVLLTGDPPARQQKGSLWYKNQPLPVYQAFETSFAFRIGSNDPVLKGGDGIAFVIQNSSMGVRSLGGPGSDLGISKSTRFTGDAGVENSVIIKVDTFDDVGFQVRSCTGRGVTAVDDQISKCRCGHLHFTNETLFDIFVQPWRLVF